MPSFCLPFLHRIIDGVTFSWPHSVTINTLIELPTGKAVLSLGYPAFLLERNYRPSTWLIAGIQPLLDNIRVWLPVLLIMCVSKLSL